MTFNIEIVPVSLIYSVKNDLVVCLQGESGAGKSTTLAHLLMNDSLNRPHDFLFIGDDPVILISTDNEILINSRQIKAKHNFLHQTLTDCEAIVSFRGKKEDYETKVAGKDLKDSIVHPYLTLQRTIFDDSMITGQSWPIYHCNLPKDHVYQFIELIDIKPIRLVLNIHRQNNLQIIRSLTEDDYLKSSLNPSDVKNRTFGSSVWLRKLYDCKIPIIDVGTTDTNVEQTVNQLTQLMKEYQL